MSMVGLVTVEVCESNVMSTLPLEDLEDEFPEVSLLRTECLMRCGLCEHNAYLYVNGHIIYGKNAASCLQRARERIEQELRWLREGDLQEVVLNVERMCCDTCATVIRQALTVINGVAGVRANVSDGTVVIAFDPAVVSATVFSSVIAQTGYATSRRDANDE